MDALEKLKVLGGSSKFDSCGCEVRKTKEDNMVKDAIQYAIYETTSETGMRTKLFKTLMSNGCSFDCKYCPNSTGCTSKGKKMSYEPEELAKTFKYLYENNYVEGIFLSSAITGDPNTAAEKMVEAVSIIRRQYRFRGYVHLKILPGENYDLIKRSAELATRLSINIEAPNKQRIHELSTTKEYKSDILRRQAWISRFHLGAGQTTQLVVGASDETDSEILNMVDWEYRAMNLRKIYFSAFHPVKGTALEKKQAVDPLREYRLYNVDFLFRKYGYKLQEIKEILDKDMLPRQDPKMLLAQRHFEGHVDLNDLDYNQMLRIPGIGPKSAKKLVTLKNSGKKIESKHQLMDCGVVVKRAMPFIELNGSRQRLINEFCV